MVGYVAVVAWKEGRREGRRGGRKTGRKSACMHAVWMVRKAAVAWCVP